MGRYINRVKANWYFLSTIASATLAPTVAEINAGVKLSDATSLNPLKDVSGFKSKATSVDTPMYGASQTPKTPGEVQIDDSALNFYLDDTTNPLHTTLAEGVSGFFVKVPPGAIAAGKKVNVYPGTVSGNNDDDSSSNEAATFNVDVTVTGIPAKRIAVLA